MCACRCVQACPFNCTATRQSPSITHHLYRLQVVLNSKSGQGSVRDSWDENIRPVFQYAAHVYVVTTTRVFVPSRNKKQRVPCHAPCEAVHLMDFTHAHHAFRQRWHHQIRRSATARDDDRRARARKAPDAGTGPQFHRRHLCRRWGRTSPRGGDPSLSPC